MAKGKETGTHLSRFANRGGQRVRQFIRDAAKPGGVAGDRLAFDVGRGVSDWINLWTGLLGFGASPQVGVADFGGFKGGTWKGGQDTNVLLADALPDNPTFPGSGTINLAPIDGGATVNLTVTGVEILDDGFELKVSVRDTTTGPPVAVGEYFANLYYTVPPSTTKQFAALIRAAVIP